ncbi:DegV family protein [Deinococcus maricopensis]|uniref:DegV family protein n=1 Tax=Deinococcus maricopensis (strain DSM 21211 / LMG 22137 / NRRL B-23946 / LB-34) TaxID=709986 RepID=E8U5Y3_DEIML|nr:DegV family protein [Deinococcus maricopensis]ADV66472.1 degV family protein [Deinococcus maricopensis DSM 21211]
MKPWRVVADGGLDAYADLLNDVPVAPFSLHMGHESFRADEIRREDLYARLRSGGPHPTSSQPTPQQFAELYRAAGDEAVLAVTISSGLSGSLNAAEGARALVPGADVTVHDSRTLSAAQAFQVHAARSARQLGHTVETARAWMQAVHAETELYFTIDTLEYLRRGGRIGRVTATLGGLLNLKPVVTVDKTSGAYTNVGRARSWGKAIEAVAQQVTARFGAGTPLRVGLLYGVDRADADTLLALLRERHELVWAGFAAVNPVLNIHTGPKAVGLAVAPGAWPWERGTA